MQRTTKQPLNEFIINNILWFLGSLLVAFVVWVIASNAADPVDVRQFTNIDVQIEHDAGLLIVDQTRSLVRVNVRAQRSVRNVLLTDDIIVTADLTGLGPGTHTVELDATVSRRASVDTIPAQITVTLEEEQARRVPVRAQIIASPPLPYANETPQFSETEAEITGPASLVEQVIMAQVELDLANQTSSIDNDVRIVPVDVEGNTVTGVIIDPQVVRLTVPISQRTDLARVSPEPDVGTDTLPEGYTIVGVDWTPRTLFISSTVADLPDALALPTEFISLEGQTSDFSVTVPIMLPDDINEDEIVFVGERNVTVTVEIAAEIDTVQFDTVPVSVLGLGQDLTALVAPEVVSVQITGPSVVLDEITIADVSVLIDLNGLQPGTYPDVVPVVSVGYPAMLVTIFPDTLSVTISGPPSIEETPRVSP